MSDEQGIQIDLSVYKEDELLLTEWKRWLEIFEITMINTKTKSLQFPVTEKNQTFNFLPRRTFDFSVLTVPDQQDADLSDWIFL